MTASSVMPAVRSAALDVKQKLLTMAIANPDSPVHGLAMDEIALNNGNLFPKSMPANAEGFAALLTRHGGQPVEATSHVEPDAKTVQRYSSHSFGAVFAEVSVDADLGVVRTRRVVAVYDIGKLLNRKTGSSQLAGGIVWGIGLALHEDTHVDPRNGRITNGNLAEYLVPVNADAPEIDISVIDIPDLNFNPVGCRGIGEIGITGTAAAIANAVYHANGQKAP